MNDMTWRPSDQINVTLEAQEWNVVLAALNEMPMRISRPVFDKIFAMINMANKEDC